MYCRDMVRCFGFALDAHAGRSVPIDAKPKHGHLTIDGQTERAIRTADRCCSRSTTDRHGRWDQQLPVPE